MQGFRFGVAGCLLIGFFVVFIAGCSDPMADTPLQRIPVVKNDTRFEIQLVGVVEDDLAYGRRRGIYVLRDKTTHKEFVGVSGIGISELGSHSTGGKNQTTVSDER